MTSLNHGWEGLGSNLDVPVLQAAVRLHLPPQSLATQLAFVASSF